MDENVFDIRQGVSITLACRKPYERSSVFHSDSWGSRERKYSDLQDRRCLSADFTELTPQSPYYFLVPKDLSKNAEYQKYVAMNELFPIHSTGVLTARDHFVIDFEDQPLRERIDLFLNAEFSDDQVATSLGLSENYAWRIADCATRLIGNEIDERFEDLHYRPLISVASLITNLWFGGPEPRSWLNSSDRNVALITSRMTKGEDFAHAFVSRSPVEVISLSSKTSNNACLSALYVNNRRSAYGRGAVPECLGGLLSRIRSAREDRTIPGRTV